MDLVYLEGPQYQQVVYEWNDTSNEYPLEKTVHQLFEEQVERTPNNLALVYEKERFTYRELNSRANHLASYLCAYYEIKPDTLIGLCIDRGVGMLVSILGVLKAGGAYVPIDPTHPDERLSYMLEDAAPALVLTNEYYAKRLIGLCSEKLSKAVVSIDSAHFEEILAKEPTQNISLPMSSDSLAYVIYTSGTTGKPKGVMIEHKRVVNTLWALSPVYNFSKNNKVTAFTTYVFDVSVAELLTPLLRGAELHLLSESRRQDVKEIANYIISQEVGHVYLPPALLSHLPRQEYKSLKTIVYAGEKCDKATGTYWSNYYRSLNFWEETNHYAPTGKQIIQGAVGLNRKVVRKF